MSRHALEMVLKRAREDGHFYQLLQSDPPAALAEYDLSQDERLALIQRDRGALEQLGVRPEWADWFGTSH
jgi:hypothetical protein